LTYLIIFVGFLIFEIILANLIKLIKKDFPWFIEKGDEFPFFDNDKYRNYLKNSFDKNLGWVRKPNTIGYDTSGSKKIRFQMDSDGSRKKVNKKITSFAASFGDSYVFGREVKDHETWQECISSKYKFSISNYGLGNYGIDQAILKYKKTNLNKTTKFVILGMVPENICRIQSEWKHFNEFGNIHGFKPKFFIKNNKLKLKPNPLKKNTKIKQLHNIIKKIKKTDRFYDEKFKKKQFKFPYLLSFVKDLRFNLTIFYIFFLKEKKLHKNYFMHEIMKRNIIQSHKLYNDTYSKKLFLKLIEEFVKIAKRRGHKPILIVFPQYLDIKFKNTNLNYIKFFSEVVSKKIDLLDLTKYYKKNDIQTLFTNQIYGSHLSSTGNKFVANKIYKFLKNLK